MKRYSRLSTIGIAVWVLPFCCVLSEGQPPSEEHLKKIGHDRLCVTIWPKKTRVQTEEYFDVSLRVVNATEKTQTFRIWSGSWFDNWKSSNARLISVGGVAITNPTKVIKLGPGEAYEETLQMAVKDGAPLVITSFQMGFTPIDEKKTYWSNRVVLGIKPGGPK